MQLFLIREQLRSLPLKKLTRKTILYRSAWTSDERNNGIKYITEIHIEKIFLLLLVSLELLFPFLLLFRFILPPCYYINRTQIKYSRFLWSVINDFKRMNPASFREDNPLSDLTEQCDRVPINNLQKSRHLKTSAISKQ